MKAITNKKLRIFLKLVIIAAAAVILCTVLVFGISAYVKSASKGYFLTPEQAYDFQDADCIIVLGCRVNDTTPSPMLSDRLLRGIELYDNGAAPKLLMSGDHGRTDYDEVNAMKQFAIDRGVPSENVFMDHAGFSTYETMYRAKEVFAAKRVIIVTQSYHLYRAVYIARALGLDAYGVSSDLQTYIKQPMYDMREVLARNKDFVMTIAKPEPTYLGEIIPISGSGDMTNDKEFT